MVIQVQPHRILTFFLLTWLLTACVPAVSPTATLQPARRITETVQPASPTPAPPQTATPSLQPTELALTPLLCSPLAVQALENIAEIITQPYLAPRQLDDGTYKDDAHHGLDLGYYTRAGINFTGTPVLAATQGTIAAIILNRPPYGNAILIETPFAQIPAHLISAQNIPAGYSLYSLYAHLQNLSPLQLGQTIACGQQIAETGLTGFTGGPHLHFETRWGPPGQVFNSMAYYQADTSAEERANYISWRMSGTFRLFDPMILLSQPGQN